MLLSMVQRQLIEETVGYERFSAIAVDHD